MLRFRKVAAEGAAIETTLMVDSTEVSLSPEIAVTVEVNTGQRRVIEYFLAPLLRHTSESLRER